MKVLNSRFKRIQVHTQQVTHFTWERNVRKWTWRAWNKHNLTHPHIIKPQAIYSAAFTEIVVEFTNCGEGIKQIIHRVPNATILVSDCIERIHFD
jgi:hypothetical protein